MSFLKFDIEEIGFFFIIFIALGAFAGGFMSGSWSGGNDWLVWGPALFLSIPLHAVNSIIADTPILAPLLFVGLFVYLQVMGDLLGNVWMWAVLSIVIVLLGV